MNSKQLSLSIAALAFLGILISARPAIAAEGAEAVDIVWTKAFAANDVEALTACYASDAVAWFPETPRADGTEAIRAALQKLFAANTISDVKLVESHYLTVGDRSVGWGTFKFTATPKSGGAAMIITGRYTDVAEQRNGKWVYTVDHASEDPDPTPEAKTGGAAPGMQK